VDQPKGSDWFLVLDLIHLYEMELRKRGRFVQMYSRADHMHPEDSKNWRFFVKTAGLVTAMNADPSVFIKTQFMGMGSMMGKRLIPQPSMLCSGKARERYNELSSTFSETYKRISEEGTRILDEGMGRRFSILAMIDHKVMVDGWENALAWLQNDRNWEHFDDDLELYHAFVRLGGRALEFCPKFIIENAERLRR